jgi:hypothetical protein
VDGEGGDLEALSNTFAAMIIQFSMSDYAWVAVSPWAVYRGHLAAPGQENGRFGDPSGRPENLPEYSPTANSGVASRSPAGSPTGWQPARPEAGTPVQVQLRPPQFGPPPGPQPGTPIPGAVSPVGYPR